MGAKRVVFASPFVHRPPSLPTPPPLAITRDSRHKRRATGGKRHPHQKQRKYESARPGANTKLGPKRIHLVRGRGGTNKFRAMRLETGNYAWASEHVTKKTRVLDVVYNASNNELVRTKTLVKASVVQIDATPFKLWYESHYKLAIVKKVADGQNVIKTEPTKAEAGKKLSKKVAVKIADRQKEYKVDPAVEAQFPTGKLLAIISSRPGQSGRADGYILEGPELAFYQKMMMQKSAFVGDFGRADRELSFAAAAPAAQTAGVLPFRARHCAHPLSPPLPPSPPLLYPALQRRARESKLGSQRACAVSLAKVFCMVPIFSLPTFLSSPPASLGSPGLR